MKILSFYLIITAVIFLNACKVEDIVSELGSSEITAKSKIGEVVNKAINEFSSDAQLAAIYGRNVNSEGKIDIQKPPTESAFVYVVQSDMLQENDFYIPVYNLPPTSSPLKFNDMLSLVKNEDIKDLLTIIFGNLATVAINSSATYDDSPQVLTKMFERSDVTNFRLNHPETKIDMFLFPSKTIDDDSLSNSADWVVNFYGDTSSLVLWLNTSKDEITNLSSLQIASGIITAKEKVGEVVNKAKSDFAADSRLTAIYGWNVNNEGKIDLLKTTENAFVYVVQSDSVAAANPSDANQFYVPVYNSTPIRSPITFGTMLGLIKDQGANEIMSRIVGRLATIAIDASASYDDSPQVLTKMFARNDVSNFRLNNPDTKVDMFLLPSKSIDTTSVSSSADWIVNFYSDSTSLVLWLNSGSGTIKNLNEL